MGEGRRLGRRFTLTAADGERAAGSGTAGEEEEGAGDSMAAVAAVGAMAAGGGMEGMVGGIVRIENILYLSRRGGEIVS